MSTIDQLPGLGKLLPPTLLAPFHSYDGTWRFGGDSLTRARAAQRLVNDLALNAAGVALVLDLLDRITRLQARLQHHDDR